MIARTRTAGLGGQRPGRRARPDLLAFGVTSAEGASWARSHGLSGSPFQRTRRTTVVREGPLQHTRGTYESVYVLPDKRVQTAAQEIIAVGAQEALAHAVAFDGHLATVPDPTHQPTGTTDCADESSSPWPAADGGCGASLLLCLACPNAHVHPGHYPRLAHLRRQLHSLRSALPDRDFHRRWHEHLLRLDDLRHRIGADTWNAALARVTESDRTVVKLLLEGLLGP